MVLGPVSVADGTAASHRGANLTQYADWTTEQINLLQNKKRSTGAQKSLRRAD